MPVRKLTVADAAFERSPGQDGDIYVADMIDSRHGAPITIGYGRYGPGERLTETMAVDDVMVILDGGLTVSSKFGAVEAGPSDIVHMPKGETVTICAGDEGATTAYVTYPNWREGRE